MTPRNSAEKIESSISEDVHFWLFSIRLAKVLIQNIYQKCDLEKMSTKHQKCPNDHFYEFAEKLKIIADSAK